MFRKMLNSVLCFFFFCFSVTREWSRSVWLRTTPVISHIQCVGDTISSQSTPSQGSAEVRSALLLTSAQVWPPYIIAGHLQQQMHIIKHYKMHLTFWFDLTFSTMLFDHFMSPWIQIQYKCDQWNMFAAWIASSVFLSPLHLRNIN